MRILSRLFGAENDKLETDARRFARANGGVHMLGALLNGIRPDGTVAAQIYHDIGGTTHYTALTLVSDGNGALHGDVDAMPGMHVIVAPMRYAVFLKDGSPYNRTGWDIRFEYRKPGSAPGNPPGAVLELPRIEFFALAPDMREITDERTVIYLAEHKSLPPPDYFNPPAQRPGAIVPTKPGKRKATTTQNKPAVPKAGLPSQEEAQALENTFTIITRMRNELLLQGQQFSTLDLAYEGAEKLCKWAHGEIPAPELTPRQAAALKIYSEDLVPAYHRQVDPLIPRVAPGTIACYDVKLGNLDAWSRMELIAQGKGAKPPDTHHPCSAPVELMRAALRTPNGVTDETVVKAYERKFAEVEKYARTPAVAGLADGLKESTAREKALAVQLYNDAHGDGNINAAERARALAALMADRKTPSRKTARMHAFLREAAAYAADHPAAKRAQEWALESPSTPVEMMRFALRVPEYMPDAAVPKAYEARHAETLAYVKTARNNVSGLQVMLEQGGPDVQALIVSTYSHPLGDDSVAEAPQRKAALEKLLADLMLKENALELRRRFAEKAGEYTRAHPAKPSSEVAVSEQRTNAPQPPGVKE